MSMQELDFRPVYLVPYKYCTRIIELSQLTSSQPSKYVSLAT